MKHFEFLQYLKLIEAAAFFLESDGVCWLHIQQSVLICFNRKAHLPVLFKLLYILN